MTIHDYSSNPFGILVDVQCELSNGHLFLALSLRPLLPPSGIHLLPNHFQAKSSLFTLANFIGVPLRIDEATSNVRWSSEVRVYIEVDLEYKLPNRI